MVKDFRFLRWGGSQEMQKVTKFYHLIKLHEEEVMV